MPGVPWHTQILADQLTLFQPRGTDYAHLITTGTLGFSDLTTALYNEILEELAINLNFLFISYRYTAIGLECGTFITFIVDLESNEVVEKLTFSFEGPLTKVIFFPTEGK